MSACLDHTVIKHQSSLHHLKSKIAPPPQSIIQTRDGNAYSYDRLSDMHKRSLTKVNKDSKGKATDMRFAGISIEQIQQFGHEDRSTTEFCVKQRWRETAVAN